MVVRERHGQLACGLAAIALACAVRLSAHDPITTKVTWSREVVRIVNKSCANCHNKDSVGPMSLTTYDEVRPWAKAIKDEVVTRRMPPWPAARGFGHFSNDPTLSPFEIELIAAWVDGGAPKGEDKDLPAKQESAPTARPSQVFRLPVRTSQPSGGIQTFAVATPFETDRWILGWTFVPNDPAVVAAEFVVDGTDVPLDAWTPPERDVAFPVGVGQRVPHHHGIKVTLKYRTSRQQQDFPVPLPTKGPEFGLKLTDKAPAREVNRAVLSCNSILTSTREEAAALPMQPGLAAPEVWRDVSRPPPPTAPDLLFAVRVIGGSPGGRLGLDVSSRRPYTPAPLLWIRGLQPSYEPVYRLSKSVEQESASISAISEGAGPDCRVVVSYASITSR